MDEQRIDAPGWDPAEMYAHHWAPGVLTSSDVKTYHAEVCYGWSAQQPLILDFAISINLDSVPLDESYPEGYICDDCLMPIPFGTVAIARSSVLDSTAEMICIACARDNEWSRMHTEPWEIDIALIRAGLAGDVQASGQGDVVITKTFDDYLTIKLNGLDQHGQRETCFLSVAADRLAAFIDLVDRQLGTDDLAFVEESFLDAGIDALEALANGHEL